MELIMLSVIPEAQVVRSGQAPCDILVVEDNTAVREVLREILHEEGYCVHSVIHGQDALDYLSETTTLPHVILLDLMMPIMTGWEFLALQRNNERLRDIPVIVLSAVSQDVMFKQLDGLGAFALFPKPINWNRLLNIISKVVPHNEIDLHSSANNSSHGQYINSRTGEIEYDLAVRVIGVGA